MLFVIHLMDQADSADKRKRHYPDHLAYLANASSLGVRIVLSGPLMSDDGTQAVGSHFVLETPDRETAESFHRADPFFKAGVWKESSVQSFTKRIG